MSVTVSRGPRPELDGGVRECVSALDQFLGDYPDAEAEVYRHGRFSIRLRVVWEKFAGLPTSRRVELFLKYLGDISPETAGDIALIILTTPAERKDAACSDEFDNPYSPELEDKAVAAARS